MRNRKVGTHNQMVMRRIFAHKVGCHESVMYLLNGVIYYKDVKYTSTETVKSMCDLPIT